MILTDREIRAALAQKAIIIDPLPESDAFSSTSVDLTLDPVLRVYKPPDKDLTMASDPSRPGFNVEDALKKLAEEVTIPAADGYHIQPSKLMIAWTKEYVNIPFQSRLAARVEGKEFIGGTWAGRAYHGPHDPLGLHQAGDGQPRPHTDRPAGGHEDLPVDL